MISYSIPPVTVIVKEVPREESLWQHLLRVLRRKLNGDL